MELASPPTSRPPVFSGTRDLERGLSKITHDHMEHLDQHGFVIVDGFLGTAWASALREEIKWLHDNNLTFPNQVRR
jgi:hypothetical protein